jgi:DNA-binding NtrC family response regulator
MRRFTVLLAANDSAMAASLTAALDPHFRLASNVRSLDELRTAIARLRADAVIVDLETISLADIASLHQEFQVPVVCTHRVPDEELWTAALDAGAADVCDRLDFPAIVRAVTQSHAVTRSTAA